MSNRRCFLSLSCLVLFPGHDNISFISTVKYGRHYLSLEVGDVADTVTVTGEGPVRAVRQSHADSFINSFAGRHPKNSGVPRPPLTPGPAKTLGHSPLRIPSPLISGICIPANFRCASNISPLIRLNRRQSYLSASRADVTEDVVGNGEPFYPFFAATRTAGFRFPGFVKTDLSGSFALKQTDATSLRAYTRIENIFDGQYYEAGYLASGATVAAGLSYRF